MLLDADRDGPVLVGHLTPNAKFGAVPDAALAFDAAPMSRRDATAFSPVEATSGRCPGAIRDALPDAWGRSLLGRVLGVEEPSEAMLLEHLAGDGLGALALTAPGAPPRPGLPVLRLGDLPPLVAVLDRVLDVEEDGPRPEEIRPLLTALGGSRPKLTVEADGATWVAKFPRPDDRWNNPRVEHGTMMLARDCGLNVTETRVIPVAGRDVLLVRRFDCDVVGGRSRRIPAVSALTMLRADEFRDDRWSYLLLPEVISPRHADLQRRFKDAMVAIGATTIQENVAAVDIALFLPGCGPILAEVKPCEADEVRYAVRTAMGQLLDYRQRHGRKVSLLVVVETRPTVEDAQLAIANGFGIAFPRGERFVLRWPT